jgi:hypothetical protein
MLAETGTRLSEAAEINDAAHSRVECGLREYESKVEVAPGILTIRRHHRVHQIERRVTSAEFMRERRCVAEIGFPDLHPRV